MTDELGPFEVKESVSKRAKARPRGDTPTYTRRNAALRNLTLVTPTSSNAAVAEELEVEAEPPQRNYSCLNYDTCLDLAASLNWESFTCGECAGKINEKLLWRARQVQRTDPVARALCDLKPITCHENYSEQVAQLGSKPPSFEKT